MTSHQIELVQRSFNLIRADIESAAMIFYDRLFQLDPSLRPMFRRPQKEQARRLAHMLTVVVSSLNRPETIMPVVQELGRRHVTYEVQPQHYVTVGDALLWALQAGLGDAFTQEVREAWTAAYLFLASTMQRAVAEAETVEFMPSRRQQA